MDQKESSNTNVAHSVSENNVNSCVSDVDEIVIDRFKLLASQGEIEQCETSLFYFFRGFD